MPKQQEQAILKANNSSRVQFCVKQHCFHSLVQVPTLEQTLFDFLGKYGEIQICSNKSFTASTQTCLLIVANVGNGRKHFNTLRSHLQPSSHRSIDRMVKAEKPMRRGKQNHLIASLSPSSFKRRQDLNFFSQTVQRTVCTAQVLGEAEQHKVHSNFLNHIFNKNTCREQRKSPISYPGSNPEQRKQTVPSI